MKILISKSISASKRKFYSNTALKRALSPFCLMIYGCRGVWRRQVDKLYYGGACTPGQKVDRKKRQDTLKSPRYNPKTTLKY